jgi:protein phosphatase
MGSTLTLALVIDGHAFVANVGDSRTYLWRGGLLQQITEDHSAVYQLYRAGALSEEGIYTHPRRNEITRNMGFRTTVQADYFQVELLPGDLLLLCCDGLWEMLHNDGIADLFLVSYGDPQRICDELVKRANQAGGDDNISVIVVQVQA